MAGGAEDGRNHPRLSLHVPEPPGRPGDAPDFSAVDIGMAGAVRRPPVDVEAAAIMDLAFPLIRVLDGEGRAHGPWDPVLAPDRLLAMLRQMAVTRIYDDRMFRAQRQGKTSIFARSTGEEAVAVAAAHALQANDMCFPTYRQQGVLIARDCPLDRMMCQIYSNDGDVLMGRQLPGFFSERDLGFFSISGNLGTQLPQAVGWAMASAIKGDDRIAAAWVGEGASAEGDFHAAATFATVYNAPVILNIVNNQWAISSFSGIAGGEKTTFAARAIGYAMPGLRVDGNDALAVYAVTRWAAERARLNLGPSMIELYTHRAESHSTSDDPTRYRPDGAAAAWPLGDPIERLKRHCMLLGIWDEERHRAMMDAAAAQVLAAQQQAEAIGTLHHAPTQEVATMFDDVYQDIPWHLREQRQAAVEEARLRKDRDAAERE